MGLFVTSWLRLSSQNIFAAKVKLGQLSKRRSVPYGIRFEIQVAMESYAGALPHSSILPCLDFIVGTLDKDCLGCWIDGQLDSSSTGSKKYTKQIASQVGFLG